MPEKERGGRSDEQGLQKINSFKIDVGLCKTDKSNEFKKFILRLCTLAACTSCKNANAIINALLNVSLSMALMCEHC